MTYFSRLRDTIVPLENRTRTLQFLSASGAIDSTLDESWEVDSWVYRSHTRYLNNTNEQPVMFIEYRKDSVTQEEIPVNKTEFVYDSQGRVISQTHFHIQTTNQTMLIDTFSVKKTSYNHFGEYDTLYSGLYNQGHLALTDLTIRSFDSSNRIVEEYLIRDDLDGGIPQLRRRKYIYQPGIDYDYLIEIYHNYSMDTVFYLDRRQTCKQDGNVKITISQKPGVSNWVAYFKEEETFNSSGKLTRLQPFSIDSAGNLFPGFLREYKYRADEAILSYQSSEYDWKTGTYLPPYYLFVFGYHKLGVYPPTKIQQPLLYPNPANDVIYLDNTGDLVWFQIVDLTGNVQREGFLEFGLNRLDTSNLKGHYYYLRLNLDNNQLQTIPVAVSH